MKQYRNTIAVSLGFFVLSALSLSAIPLIEVKEHSPGVIAVAAVFWGGLLLGLALFFLASAKFRKYRNRAYERRLLQRQPLPGALTFRAAPSSLVLYLILAASVVCVVTDLIWHWAPGAVMFPILTVTLTAFVLHCFLDGRDYRAYAKMKEGMKNGRK